MTTPKQDAVMVENPTSKFHPPVDSYTVWHWPEFQALLKRLGVDVKSPITATTISVPLDGPITITQVTHGLDTTKDLG